MTETKVKPQPLAGRTVAVGGGRRFEEIEKLITKLGGKAEEYVLMNAVPLNDPSITEPLKKVCAEGFDYFIGITGMGVKAMLQAAELLELREVLTQHLRDSTLAVRGYKTVKALKELDLKASVQDDDGSVEGLVRPLKDFDFAGKSVAIQLHGESLADSMPSLRDLLESQGASYTEIPLYHYSPPSDELVTSLLAAMQAGEVTDVAFTSKTQVKFLFEIAERLGKLEPLRNLFATTVTAVSVGHMTSGALREWGIERIVQPEQERMGAMIMKLVEYQSISYQSTS